MKKKKKICVVIPCFNVRNSIEKVIKKIDFRLINKVIIVDDCCPEKTGSYLIKKKFKNLIILRNKKNLGVGGATLTGINYAIKRNFFMIVKIDGDGQHNLSVISKFKNEIFYKNIDLCKGYRKLSLKDYKKNKMPLIRLIGAKVLTIITRINSGKFDLEDPCHGLIGFSKRILKKINLDKIQKNYFFEQDIILNVIKQKGKVKQFRNEVTYGNESSKLNPIMSILPFIYYHMIHLIKKFI